MCLPFFLFPFLLLNVNLCLYNFSISKWIWFSSDTSLFYFRSCLITNGLLTNESVKEAKEEVRLILFLLLNHLLHCNKSFCRLFYTKFYIPNSAILPIETLMIALAYQEGVCFRKFCFLRFTTENILFLHFIYIKKSWRKEVQCFRFFSHFFLSFLPFFFLLYPQEFEKSKGKWNINHR